MRSKYIIFITLLSLISLSAHADKNNDSGLNTVYSWTNQKGSTLTIDKIDTTGQISGTYINRAKGYSCQNISYPVTGWIYGTAITFTTLWKNTAESCNSITAWTGFYNQGKIKTLWQLTINGPTSTSLILKGNDTFVPSATPNRKSLTLNQDTSSK